MNRDQLTLIESIAFDRKPNTLSEVGSDVRADSGALDRLLTLNVDDITERGAVLGPFVKAVPQYFILAVQAGGGRDRYLVNTEGYDYARYITRIEELTPADLGALAVRAENVARRRAHLIALTTEFASFCADAIADGHGDQGTDESFFALAVDAFNTMKSVE